MTTTPDPSKLKDHASALSARIRKFEQYLIASPFRSKCQVGSDAANLAIGFDRSGQDWAIWAEHLEDDRLLLRDARLDIKIMAVPLLETLLHRMEEARGELSVKVAEAAKEMDVIFERLGIPNGPNL